MPNNASAFSRPKKGDRRRCETVRHKQKEMKKEPTKIELYDKREKVTSTMYVEKIGENKFRMIDNALFNCTLTLGTEFETRVNEEGKYEVIRIAKKSKYITRRFFLSQNYKESDYRMLGDELVKNGGFWQVDMGGIATINLPQDFKFDINQVMKDLDLRLIEIVED